MRKGAIAFAVAASVAMFVVIGCGGGDDEPPTLTKAAFVKQGEAICVQTEKERGDALRSSPLEPFKKELTKSQQEELVLDSALPPVQKMADELAELGKPKGEEEKAETMLDDLDAAIERSEEEPLTAIDGSAFAKYNKEAVAFGFTSCSV